MKTALTIGQHHDAHHNEGHAERPERIHAIERVLKEDGLLNHLIAIEPEAPEKEDIERVHSAAYYQSLVDASEAGHAWLDSDTYSTPESLTIAREALGGLLAVTRHVAQGEADNGFAAVRPPGHHARPAQAMGFCLLANVAIAARWVQAHTPFKRIVIVDYDVHHGNGTEEIFFDDPDVLFISTHQHPLYPGTGLLEDTGSGAGKGTTINIPLPAGTGDESMVYVFETILRPRVLQFNPDFVFLSAGYDAHWRDPLGGLQFTVSGFAAMTREVMHWAETCAGNRLVGLLEGGYDLDALAHSVLATLHVLHDPQSTPADPIGSNPVPYEVHEHLNEYLEELARYHNR